MPYCIKCGKQIPDNVSSCPNCGTAIQPQQPNPNRQEPVPPTHNYYNMPPEYYNQQKPSGRGTSPLGLIVLIIGLCGLAFAIFKILGDMTAKAWERYTYVPPFTEHEIGVIVILVISLIVSIIGACTVKKK